MYSPDERRSIQAEMNRDAMPSPEEVEAEHKRNLAEEGCRRCGENDPDRLTCVGHRRDGSLHVFCDDCLAKMPEDY